MNCNMQIVLIGLLIERVSVVFCGEFYAYVISADSR